MKCPYGTGGNACYKQSVEQINILRFLCSIGTHCGRIKMCRVRKRSIGTHCAHWSITPVEINQPGLSRDFNIGRLSYFSSLPTPIFTKFQVPGNAVFLFMSLTR